MKLADSDNASNSDDSDDVRRSSDSGGRPAGEPTPSDFRGNLERELKQLARLMRRESSILKQNVSAQRDKVRRECEALLKQDEHRDYALNTLWIHYWYAPVKTIIGKPKVSDTLKAWLKNFIICGIRHLENIAVKYPSLRPTTLVFIGDLHRYAYANCGCADANFNRSRDSYLSAFDANPANGRAFNQLALLCQESGDEWKSLGYFLKALVVRKPFSRAFDNARRLDEREFDEESGHNATLNFVSRLIAPFSRTTVEKWRKLFEAALDANLEVGEWRTALEMIHCLFCLAFFYSHNEEFDDQMRVLSAVLCLSWTSLLGKFIEKPRDELLLSVLAGAGEFVSRLLLPKKISVSLKLVGLFNAISSIYWIVEPFQQYQNVVQLYAELLNANIAVIRQAEVDPDSLVEKAESVWIPGAPFIDDIEVVVAFMKLAIDNAAVPLSFDCERFRAANLSNIAASMTNKGVTVERRQSPSATLELPPAYSPPPVVNGKSATGTADKVKLMEKIGRLHAAFQQQEEEKKQQKSMLPVYLFPDASVFLDKLSVLQNLATLALRNNCRFIVIVAELVLRQLDRQKRENQRAREAIRWLQSALTGAGGGKIRLEMLSIRDGDVPNAALHFVEEQKLLDRKSLFATVLTAVKKPMDHSENGTECSNDFRNVFTKYNSLSIENIDAFFIRIVELEDGDPFS